MKKTLLLLSLALPLLAQPKENFIYPGSTLGDYARICGGTGTVKLMCFGYISGYVNGVGAVYATPVAMPFLEGKTEKVGKDMIAGKVAINDDAVDRAIQAEYSKGVGYCVASTWTLAYVDATAMQYAREHPEALQEPLREQMLKILAKAFPCAR
jgi:hypothetical protein